MTLNDQAKEPLSRKLAQPTMSELEDILQKYFTGEQHDEMHGTFIRIPFTKQMEKATKAIQAYTDRAVKENLEQVIAVGHNLECIFCGLKDKKANDLTISVRDGGKDE